MILGQFLIIEKYMSAVDSTIPTGLDKVISHFDEDKYIKYEHRHDGETTSIKNYIVLNPEDTKHYRSKSVKIKRVIFKLK